MNTEIKRYKFRNGLPLEFEMISISDLYRSKKNMLVSPHRTDFYHIIWIQKGHPTHFVDFKPYTLSPDSILFVPKNCVNRFDTEADYEGQLILFTDHFFGKNLPELQYLRSTILFHDLYEVAQISINTADSELITHFRAMGNELAKPNDNAQYDILRNLLHNFLLLSERERRRQGFKEIKAGADLEFVLLYKDLLDQHFKTQKSVAKYASDLSISEKRLNKATTLILDKTPKQLIDDRVVIEAKRLLAHSTINIKEIAFELGFEEPTNFIKYFRKHTQSTPSEFREHNK